MAEGGQTSDDYDTFTCLICGQNFKQSLLFFLPKVSDSESKVLLDVPSTFPRIPFVDGSTHMLTVNM
jgi:hypothetical protein